MKTREEIKAIVIETLVDVKPGDLSPDSIKETDLLRDDLGIDSLDYVEMIMKFERKFEIGISDLDAEPLENSPVADWIEYLQERIQK